MGAEEIGISQVIPKTFVFAFVPLVLYLFIKDYKKYSLPAVIVSSALVYFHSITAIPITIILLYSLFFEKKDYRLFLVCLVVSMIGFAPYFLTTFMGRSEFDIAAVKAYSDITYPQHALLSISKYLLVIIPGIFFIRKTNREIFRWMIILTGFSAITVFGYVSDDILMMQFFRAFRYVIYFSFMFSALFVIRTWGKNKTIALILAALIFLPFSSIFYSTAFSGITKPQNVYLSKAADAQKIGTWLSENTILNETILIPPDWSSIKTWSKRSTVITFHDIGMCFYNKTFSEMCIKRYNEVSAVYSEGSTGDFETLANRYGSGYIVTYDKSLCLEERFSSGKFKIYSKARGTC
jgi:hypothetical protein